MKSSDKLYYGMCLMVLGIMLVECASNAATNNLATPTLEDTKMPIETPRVIITPSTTPTHLPTVDPTQRPYLAAEIFRTNAGCIPPCWMGITPGKTTWEEAKRFLETFSRVDDGNDYGDYHTQWVKFSVPEEISPGDISNTVTNVYFVEDGVVELIEISLPIIDTYTLDHVLNDFGVPNIIFVFSSFNEYMPIYVGMTLIYETQGIIASYSILGSDAGESVLGCPGEDPLPYLVVWNNQKDWDYQKIRDMLVRISLPTRFHIEEVTEFTPKSYFEDYSQNGIPSCITIDKRLISIE